MFDLIIVFTFLYLLDPSVCFKSDNGTGKHMFLKVEQLRERARNLYGGVVEKPINEWEHGLDDRLAYPRGDKKKLQEISQHWLKYYECCAHTLHNMTSTQSLPATSITVYAGAVVRLPCGLCVAPSETDDVTWLYAESLKNLTFRPMEEKDTAVKDKRQLTIYHARPEDGGVYTCRVGHSSGGYVVLEVVDYEENYTVVKPPSSHGPYAAPSVTDEEFTVFTAWSPWSECSRCERWGRKRRFGMCQVKVSGRSSRSEKDDIKSTSPKHSQDPKYCHEGKMILEGSLLSQKNRLKLADKKGNSNFIVFRSDSSIAFPLGFRCRSRWLPACVTNRPAVRDRPNEIMISMCKPQCEKDVIFTLKSSNGELEEVNESANTSLLPVSRIEITKMQNHQPQPAIMFAVRGEPATIACPGKTHRDMPVRWRVGPKAVCERSLVKSSGGRVKVNARDQMELAAVWDSDANVYSCWQRDVLVGRVRLWVWAGRAAVAGRAALLAALGAAAYLFARLWKAYTVLNRRDY